MQPRTQLSSAIFIPDEMRNSILERNEIANMVDPSPNPDIPAEIDNYHTLYPLEAQPIHQKHPLPSSTYRATHNTTGIKYCLRRLNGEQSLPKTEFCYFYQNRSLMLFSLPFTFHHRLPDTVYKMYDCG